MEYTRLGKTGLKVSRLCLGMMTYGSRQWRPWALEEEEAQPFIRRALEAGINFFDTADMYSLGRSEEILGNAIHKFGPGRDKVVIATKVFQEMSTDPNDRGLSRKHIMHAVDASLKRLKTDYIDLYQIHRFDYNTPIEETLSALHDVVKAGKALYIGSSSMYAWQFMKMLATADRLGLTRFVSMQNCYNLLYREEEREMLPLCREEGIGVIPFSPLARGFVAGNRNRERSGSTTRAQSDELSLSYYFTPQDFTIVDRITEVAERRGTSNAKIALAWVLQQPGIHSPIIGATKPHHISDAVAALEMKLEGQELKALAELYRPRPIMAHS